MPERICSVCGAHFVAKTNAKTCPGECRKAYKKAKKAEWYQGNREVSLARSAARRESNREEAKAYDRVYYLANKPKLNAASRARYAADVEESREKHRAYNERHRAKRRAEDPIEFRAYVNAGNSKRRRASRQATPPRLTASDWAAIESVYAEAARLTIETGIKHDVDHGIGLGVPNACGLHVPANLQAVPASENRSKHNNYNGPDAWPSEVVAEWIRQHPEFLNGLPRGWEQQQAA